MSIYKLDDIYNVKVNGIYKNDEYSNSEFTVDLYIKDKKALNNQMFFSLNPENHGRITDFTLSLNHRNRGIGQFMYYCLVDHLYKNNVPIKKISGEFFPLDLENNGELLKHFYNKLGFTVGDRSFKKEVGNLYTEVLLQEYVQKLKQSDSTNNLIAEAYHQLKRENKNILNHIRNNKLCRFFYNIKSVEKI